MRLGELKKGIKENTDGEKREKKMKQGRVNLSKIGENKVKVGHRKFMQVSKIGFQY